MSGPPMHRREFVAACATACAGLMAGCVSMVTHPVPMAGGLVRLTLADYPALTQPGGAIRVQPAGLDEAVLVVADAPDGFRALSPICTHRGCTVDVRGDRLVCPCHGSTYDRAGAVLKGPAERPLGQYALRRDGGEIVIDVRATGDRR